MNGADDFRMIRPAGIGCPQIGDALADFFHRFTGVLEKEVEALGPPTLENLSRFIWERIQHAGKITRVSVHRDSCNESCTYYGPQG